MFAVSDGCVDDHIVVDNRYLRQISGGCFAKLDKDEIIYKSFI